MSNDIQVKKFEINKINRSRYDEMKKAGTLPPNSIIATPEHSTINLPIGAIFPSALPILDASVHLLDGSTIAQDGVYADFVTLLKTLVSSGYNISCSQEEFNTDVGNTGNCGKFVIDDTAGTIRLPKITKFIQGIDSITNIGSSLEAGLPNITGNVGADDGANSYLFSNAKVTNGAFQNNTSAIKIKYSTDLNTSTSNDAWGNAVSFDASRSSNVYGNSNTVQPPSTQYPYYIVLAGGYKTDAQVNIDNVMSEVNLKAQKDASNLDTSDVENWKNKLSSESVETIYDMSSSDSSINWGYTGGLANETVVTGKNLSKYKRIRGYWYLFGAPSGVFEVDLTGYLSNVCRAFVVLNSDSYSAGIVISKDTGDITISTANPPSGSNYIYKIEGVY